MVSARVFTPLLKLKFPTVAFSPLKYLNIFGVPLINTFHLRVIGKFHKAPLNRFDFDFKITCLKYSYQQEFQISSCKWEHLKEAIFKILFSIAKEEIRLKRVIRG